MHVVLHKNSENMMSNITSNNITHVCGVCNADWSSHQFSAGCPSCEERLTRRITADDFNRIKRYAWDAIRTYRQSKARAVLHFELSQDTLTEISRLMRWMYGSPDIDYRSVDTLMGYELKTNDEVPFKTIRSCVTPISPAVVKTLRSERVEGLIRRLTDPSETADVCLDFVWAVVDAMSWSPETEAFAREQCQPVLDKMNHIRKEVAETLS